MTNNTANNCKFPKFSTTNRNFEKKNISDMHQCTTYMYIKFQQNQVSTSVKTYCKLLQFAQIYNYQ